MDRFIISVVLKKMISAGKLEFCGIYRFVSLIELGVRLVGGNSSLEGRIEIWYNNTWGTVCDDRFDSREAEVVCHMLGYERLGAMPYMEAAYGQGNGPIWVDELQCQGNEISVRDCLHSPWGLHDCGHKEDAGVKCRTKKNDDRNRMITVELDLVVEETEKHKIFDRYKSYRKNAVKDPSKRWKENTIYYVFGDGIDNSKTDLIRDVLDEWSDYSCIDFSKSVSNDNYNQIVFISKQGDERCGSTYVGMKPGSQEIYLGKDCFKRDIILHEVGHALGFYHEHNRADRDSYIKIHYENIEQGYEDNLKKMKQNEYEDFDKPYDYRSIMHYGQYFFSKNERITIETLKPEYQDIIGKARHPSFLDYKILNTMYECSARCDDIKCPDGGFLGKNCYCYCEEDEDDKSIRPCFKKKKCPNPSINSYLFDVLDKRNEIWVNVSYINHYPDKTVLNLFSTNKKCTLASQLQCDKGTWKGNIQDCPVQLELQSVDGSGNEGIVEVKLNGEYGFIGYICDDDWDDNDATVACRMMGFE
ncbi:zinc metalloproteinase nas-36-like isoform X2 [Mercenaria mercenaria]|uniref:zinc metalloproteinase nas-36-like isoform X2 n=1 Tax=Mercenaria mercenaria TaxID=6596 RepID=UPI00234F3B0D|nr:zinc metalloproteinase nas-36-like isoform X2 [Mercenaria mercenaria]